MKLVIRVESPDAEPTLRECTEPLVTIGRNRHCGIRIFWERFAAHYHARFFVRDESWFLEELGTRNTTVNGNRFGPVFGSEPHRLSVGDLICIGDTIITVEGVET